MADYAGTVYLIQYERSGDGVKRSGLPAHWEIGVRHGIEKKMSYGTIFHIIGGTGNMWHFERKDDVRFTKSLAFAGSMRIGHVALADLPKIQSLLATVELQHGHPTWNCQDWAWAALRLLRQKQFNITLPANKPAMEAKAQREAWDRGYETDGGMTVESRQ